MKNQIVDICGVPHILSRKSLPVYRFYCNTCYRKGQTIDRQFQCHPGKTRIVLDDQEVE